MRKDGQLDRTDHLRGAKNVILTQRGDKTVVESTRPKKQWKDVFDNITYSNGPGDNIYVFG